MIHDLLVSRHEGFASADICIVGAGAAGIVLGVELARRGRTVLMLEAGGAEIEPLSQEPYLSEIAGLPFKGIHSGRFRVKGGTTTKWGGQILELDAADFTPRRYIDSSGWPFEKSELASHYERALDMEGLSGVTRQDVAVWQEIGLTPPTFSGLEPYFSRWCPEPNFARLHGPAIQDHPGLHLWLHTNAVTPLFDGEAMCGLKCRTLSGLEATFRADKFVFCLGTIESCRFFLQPLNNGETGLPWNRSGLLGKHFQDHIDTNAATVEPINRQAFHRVFDNIRSRGFKYHPKLRLASIEQAKHGTLNIAATMNFVSDADEASGQLKATAKNLLRGRIGEVGLADLKVMVHNFPLFARQAIRYKLQHRVYNPADADIFLRIHCEQEPTGRSSITLASTRDSLGLFRARLDWHISSKEIATIRHYVEEARRALAGIARVLPNPDLISGSSDFLALCNDSNHHMGGMRMSGSREGGVVDPNLRLYGLNNTYICSGAVFPTSGFSNPTHTLIALALRLGAHLTEGN